MSSTYIPMTGTETHRPVTTVATRRSVGRTTVGGAWKRSDSLHRQGDAATRHSPLAMTTARGVVTQRDSVAALAIRGQAGYPRLQVFPSSCGSRRELLAQVNFLAQAASSCASAAVRVECFSPRAALSEVVANRHTPLAYEHL
jgi:hypothetical protein